MIEVEQATKHYNNYKSENFGRKLIFLSLKKCRKYIKELTLFPSFPNTNVSVSVCVCLCIMLWKFLLALTPCFTLLQNTINKLIVSFFSRYFFGTFFAYVFDFFSE